MVASGAELFQSLACVTCHRTGNVRDTGRLARGPALEGLYGNPVKLADLYWNQRNAHIATCGLARRRPRATCHRGGVGRRRRGEKFFSYQHEFPLWVGAFVLAFYQQPGPLW